MRTNKSFRITYFDASTSENVGYAGFINLGGETINTDEWALLNMPEEVAQLQDSTEILWDAESMSPAVAEACHMQERIEPRKPPYDPRMTTYRLVEAKREEFLRKRNDARYATPQKTASSYRFRQVNRRKRSKVSRTLRVALPWIAISGIIYALVAAIR